MNECEHIFVSLYPPQFGEWGKHWRVRRCVVCGLIEANDGTIDLHERRIIKFENYEGERCDEDSQFYM